MFIQLVVTPISAMPTASFHSLSYNAANTKEVDASKSAINPGFLMVTAVAVVGGHYRHSLENSNKKITSKIPNVQEKNGPF
jgi:hypothetical protein